MTMNKDDDNNRADLVELSESRLRQSDEHESSV